MSETDIKGKMPVGLRERTGIIDAVAQRVLYEKLLLADQEPESAIEYVINDTVYHERNRLKRIEMKSDEEDLELINRFAHQLPHADMEKQKSILDELVRRYADDIAGRFDPRVYDFSTSALPYALAMLFNVSSPAVLLRTFPNMPDLRSRIILRGRTEETRRLAERGTLIYLPTHVSNMDSVVVGWSLVDAGLPPANYGAGKNLFSNKLLGFFMNSLGAYKVDRRIKHQLYKDVLKAYSTVILERGFHSLFFPGGTRSRSGALESRLKLGLVGTGLDAYINNLKQGREKPNIYFVPMTINYHLVLEAETLIEDYLQEAGKSRYIIVDDEFSKPERIIRFGLGMLNMEASLMIEFGRALDPFGNPVDEDGGSLDDRGREVDISRYVLVDGEPAHSPDRDREYTLELGRAVIGQLRAHTVALPTHIAAFAIFNLFRDRNPEADLYRLLRLDGEAATMPIKDAQAAIQRTAEALLELADRGLIRLGGPIRPGECASEIFADAFRYLTMYHTKPALKREGGKLLLNDLSLLYYYQNRLTGYGLEESIRGGGPHD